MAGRNIFFLFDLAKSLEYVWIKKTLWEFLPTSKYLFGLLKGTSTRGGEH